jgi:hypothetical protein
MICQRSPLTWILYGLFVCCLLMRFMHLDAIEFKADEFKAVKMAFDNIHHHLALSGLRASNGLYNPPFFIYLMSLPVSVTHSPEIITGFVVFLNIVGLGLWFLLLRRLFSEENALFMIVLFASAPWALVYSRKIWAQDCLVPFMAGIFWLMTDLKDRYKSWKVWVLAALIAVVTQLHMSAWFLPLALAVYIFLNKVRIEFRDVFIGVLIIIGFYVPYFLFHIQSDFQNIREFINVQKALSTNTFTLQNFRYAADVSTGINFQYLLGRVGWSWFTYYYHMWIAVIIFYCYEIAGMIALIGTGISVFLKKITAQKMEKRWENDEGLIGLFLCVFFMIQLFYFLLWIPASPHYGIIFYPFYSVILVFAADRWFQNMKVRNIFKALFCIVIVSHLLFSFSFLDMTKKHPGFISGDYGAPYFTQKTLWQQVFRDHLK